MANDHDSDRAFEHHPPTSDAVADAHAAIRQRCRELDRYLVHVLPGCDAKAQALNKVREAMMWANHAVAITQRVGNG